MKRGLALAVLALVLAPGSASAHLVGIEFGDFYAGALHVATGPAYAAGLCAIILLAALQGERVGRWALLVTPAAMSVGAWFGASGVWPAGGEVAAMAALAALGVMAALGRRIGERSFATLIGLSSAANGYANGLAAAAVDAAPGGGVDHGLYALGVGAIGLVAAALGAAGATVALTAAPQLAVAYRVLGSWIAAVGLAMLGLTAAQLGA